MNSAELTTPVSQLQFLGIDFEGAGARLGIQEEPVQLGLARLGRNRRIAEQDLFVSLIRPSHPVTEAARRIHQISDELLVDAPILAELWPAFSSRLENHVLVAWGAATERRYLEGFPAQDFSCIVDVLHLARAAWPHWESHSLEDACLQLDLVEECVSLYPQASWHDACFDALATVLVLKKLLSQLDEESVTLEHLLYPDMSAYHAIRRKTKKRKER